MRFNNMAPEIAGAVSNSYMQLIINTTERCNVGWTMSMIDRGPEAAALAIISKFAHRLPHADDQPSGITNCAKAKSRNEESAVQHLAFLQMEEQLYLY